MAGATDTSLSVHNEGAVVLGKGAGIIPDTVREEATRSVVFIDTQTSQYGQGSGFLTKLPFQGDDRALLVTCNHVIPDVEIAKKCFISFDRLDAKTPGTQFSGEILFDLNCFKTDATNVQGWKKLLDYTIIGVKMDVLRTAALPNGPPTPLLMTDFQNMTEELKVKDMVSVVHYPMEPPGFQRCTNSERILKIEGPMFGHSATTQGGSSGCPVFREFERRWIVVGLHRGDLPFRGTTLTNLGTKMSMIFDAFMGKPYSDHVPDIAEFAYGAHALVQESTADSDVDPILSTNVYDKELYLVLLRKYVSKQAAGNGRALLALLGLDQPSIAAVYGQIDQDEIEAIQKGLVIWSNGRASKQPTWDVLLKAMADADIAKKACEQLEEELTETTKDKSAKSDSDNPILSANVYDTEPYLVLLRKYVSKQAAGNGRALLALLGLDQPSIAAVYGQIDHNEIEAIQKGLVIWSNGRASKQPTWDVLLKAMADADIAKKACEQLKKELTGGK